MIAATLALMLAAGLTGVAARPERAGQRPRAWHRVLTASSWLLLVAAAVLAVVLGSLGVAGHRSSLGLGDLGGLGSAALTVDRLSGLFLVICFAVAIPVLLAGGAVAPELRPRLSAAIAVTLAAVFVIITADHLFVFLFGWEALTFAFYLLAGYDRGRAERARASVAAAGFGKLSGAALLVGGLLLAANAGTLYIGGLAGAARGASTDVGYALLLLGFGVKVGLVPVQVWLPPAYRAAPGPARAVMAGVAANVGFYGMWRTLAVLGPPPVWLVVMVLITAGCTAILGIAHAAVHPDLVGLVAWSSVENAGVITAGFGAAMVGAAAGVPLLTAAGLLAATAQVCAHALGKSLLFVATASIEDATGTLDLDTLRGISRPLPWAGAGLVVGSLTLAGLPLTAGFASEWLTLESLMQQFRVNSLPMQLASAAAGALVALTVGVAGVTFVRLIGFTAFGSPSTPVTARARHQAPGVRAAVAMLGVGCLGLAAITPLQVRFLAAGLRPVVGSATQGALRSPWVIQPVYGAFSALSPTWLWIAIPALTLVCGAACVALSGRRMFQVRRVPAWSSASPGVDRGVGYTSFGYANPIRRVLANLLLTRSQLRSQEDVIAAASHSDTDPPHRAAAAGLHFRVDVVEVVETYLYRPFGTALLALVRVARRLQSGRLDAYLTYMLIALVAMLAIVSATA
jgi:formate hydrogenlyase subunit 3/multisubunit Na+/H+ antiporter MnhD subunit